MSQRGSWERALADARVRYRSLIRKHRGIDEIRKLWRRKGKGKR